MRRSTRVAAVAAALTILTTALFALPDAAAADAQASYAGTYTGVAGGHNTGGKKGSSGVTVWVQVAGDQVTFTFRLDKLPVVVTTTGTAQQGAGAGAVVSLTVNKPGIHGSGTLTFRVSKDRWLLYGTGSGKALKYQGTGQMTCWRVSTGVALPSTVTQITDVFSALGGSKPSTALEVSDTSAGSSASPEPSAQPTSAAVPPPAAAGAGPNATPASSSIVDLAGQEPSVSDTNKLTALGTIILVLTMCLVLGLLAPRQEGS